MFVQSKDTTVFDDKNGVALKQRRGSQETLVEWQSGRRRWVDTTSLQGDIVLFSEYDSDDGDDEDAI
jgi:hypothetical protein